MIVLYILHSHVHGASWEGWLCCDQWRVYIRCEHPPPGLPDNYENNLAISTGCAALSRQTILASHGHTQLDN